MFGLLLWLVVVATPALFVLATVVVVLLLLLLLLLSLMLLLLLVLLLLLLLLLLVLNGKVLTSGWPIELTGCTPFEAAMTAGVAAKTVGELEDTTAVGVDAIISANSVVGPID